MSQEVLVLNSDYEPLNVCNLRRAIVLIYLGKADVLHAHGESSNATLPPAAANTAVHPAAAPGGGGVVPVAPSVVKLRHHVKRPLPELKLSRRSVFARDNFTCQYCGMTSKELTIDHVVPKRHGGGMHWENLVACCRRCNTKKGDKTPEKVGMKADAPAAPAALHAVHLAEQVRRRNETRNLARLPARFFPTSGRA
jgi:5-methylcytosine-specific restriction endonuclease McrA